MKKFILLVGALGILWVQSSHAGEAKCGDDRKIKRENWDYYDRKQCRDDALMTAQGQLLEQGATDSARERLKKFDEECRAQVRNGQNGVATETGKESGTDRTEDPESPGDCQLWGHSTVTHHCDCGK